MSKYLELLDNAEKLAILSDDLNSERQQIAELKASKHELDSALETNEQQLLKELKKNLEHETTIKNMQSENDRLKGILSFARASVKFDAGLKKIAGVKQESKETQTSEACPATSTVEIQTEPWQHEPDCDPEIVNALRLTNDKMEIQIKCLNTYYMSQVPS